MGDFPLPWCFTTRGGYMLRAPSVLGPKFPADRLQIPPSIWAWARFKIEDLGTKGWTTGHCIRHIAPSHFGNFDFGPRPSEHNKYNKIITRFLVLFACCCDPMVNGAGSELWCVAANRVDQVNRVQSGSLFLPVGKIGGSCENHFGFGRLRAKPQASVVYHQPFSD